MTINKQIKDELRTWLSLERDAYLHAIIREVVDYTGLPFENVHFVIDAEFEQYAEDLFWAYYPELRDHPMAKYLLTDYSWVTDFKMDYSYIEYDGDKYWYGV